MYTALSLLLFNIVFSSYPKDKLFEGVDPSHTYLWLVQIMLVFYTSSIKINKILIYLLGLLSLAMNIEEIVLKSAMQRK